MPQKLIMCKWLPASGKSTWAKEYVKSTAKSVRINNDDLRKLLYSDIFTNENEKALWIVRETMILDYLDRWYTVVVDNTNINPIHELNYRDIANDYKIPFEVKEFPVDVQTCIDRDRLRGDDSVWENVIRDMAKKWNYYPEPPREFEKIVQSFWEDAFIVDMDGTLAYINDRNPYDYSKVSTDGCYSDIREIINWLFLHCHKKIIIVSGRKEECREDTENWLKMNSICYNELHMRKSSDNRKDSIVKYEILVNDIIPKYYVKGVFDDRDQVVKMWREAGLRCYQVNYGNF